MYLPPVPLELVSTGDGKIDYFYGRSNLKDMKYTMMVPKVPTVNGYFAWI